MPHQSTPLPRAQQLTRRALSSLERFLHIEAVSGVVLLFAALIALLWANSPYAASYHHLWHIPLTFGLGEWVVAQPLHFWVNDALMTVFFLVVGMEIRREIHEGALSNLRMAALPVVAALGGVCVPALIYLAFNHSADTMRGWAVPTATDIAFAVGVLALLGKSIPSNIRIFLLSLAIIDDIVAVLIIAFFYSGGLEYSGFAVASAGVLLVLALQHMGFGSAYVYLLPGAVVWCGLLMTGAHPTLAGVVLGLLTPVVCTRHIESPQDTLARIGQTLPKLGRDDTSFSQHLRQLRFAQRELLPPVIRVQQALHPWVAYGVMPLFALANAGVTLGSTGHSSSTAASITLGVAIALVLGKPLGVMGACWLSVRAGWCRLPEGVNWQGILLAGLLAGIGFTMSIFISMLAFTDAGSRDAAKLGVLIGSSIAALLGLACGWHYVRRQRRLQFDGTPS